MRLYNGHFLSPCHLTICILLRIKNINGFMTIISKQSMPEVILPFSSKMLVSLHGRITNMCKASSLLPPPPPLKFLLFRDPAGSSLILGRVFFSL